ncbi:MAG TPA: tetratricopeptide repeat protein [Candidatus Nanoarchaeia archaeon]
MKENISIISTRVIQIGLVLLAFLIPIFFLPTTSEFYNFNKTVLLVVGAFFLFFVWGAKMAAEQKVQLTRTPLDIPLILFLGIYIAATVFSLDPIISFLGTHPVFFGSLPSVAALIIIYFLATTHLNAAYRRGVFIAFALSATILAVASIAYYFGHPFLGTDWAQARQWTAAGDLTKLAIFLAISIPLTISLSFFMKDSWMRYITYILAALQIISFALVNILPAYVILVAAALFTLLFVPRLRFKQEEKAAFGVLAVILAIVLVLVNVKGVGDAVFKPLISGKDNSISLTKPLKLPLTAAWQTSARALANRPVFGSGPATYGLVFPSFKPISLNTINENNLWNIRFDSSGSGVLDLLATTGVLGVLALLFIIVVLIRNMASISIGAQPTERNTSFILLQAALIASLVSWIIFDISTINGLAFLLLAATFYSTLRDLGSSQASEISLQLVALKAGAIRAVEAGPAANKPNSLSWVFFVPALVLFAAIAFYSWSTYRAEFFYQRAIVASLENKGRDTRDNLVAAINTNPYRDTYHRALLVTDLALARSLSQQGGEQLTEDQQNTLLALVREAIDQGRITTGYEGRGLGSFQIKRSPGTAALNVANWESLAIVYANIGGELRQDATIHAINTYSQALQLDPTNPRLYEALGNVYMNLGDVDNAIRNYELAVSAKFDYASGHYSLAQAVRKKGDNPARVVNELSATLQLLEDNKQNKADRERIQKELADARKELEKAGKQGQQTTQLQQTQQATPSAAPGQ